VGACHLLEMKQLEPIWGLPDYCRLLPFSVGGPLRFPLT
jgi:hypothetical protein